MLRKLLMSFMVFLGIAGLLIIVGGLSLSVQGCATPRSLYQGGMMAPTGTVVYTDAQCKTLHNEEIALSTVTAVVAALSGSTGVSAAFVDNPRAQQEALGITAIVSGVVSAGIGTWLHFVQEDFSSGCTTAPDSAVPTPIMKKVGDESVKTIMKPTLTCTDCDWYKGGK